MATQESLPATIEADSEQEYHVISRRSLLRSGEARKVGEEVRKYLNREKTQIWLPIAPMPTDLCRVSPFFPDNRRDIKEHRRELIHLRVIAKNSWGSVKFTGPRLTTYDEDALLAVLAILNQLTFDKKLKKINAPVYEYTGPILPILKLMGLTGGADNYKRLLNSLMLLSASVLILRITEPKTTEIANIISRVHWDDKAKFIRIKINPYFYETYQQKHVTLIDVWERSKIKSVIAKCLYRFMKSQRSNNWDGHLMTLVAVLNLDSQKEARFLRRDIKRGIAELVKVNFLEKESGFKGRDNNIVTLIRNPLKVRVGKKITEQETIEDLKSFGKGLAGKMGLPKDRDEEKRKHAWLIREQANYIKEHGEKDFKKMNWKKYVKDYYRE